MINSITVSANIRRFYKEIDLKNYDFDLVLFFFYIADESEKYDDEFRLSDKQILNDIGIKRSKLKKIIDFLCKEEVIRVEVKGMPAIKHYSVDIYSWIKFKDKIKK